MPIHQQMISSANQPRLEASSQESRFHVNEEASPGDIQLAGIDLSVISSPSQDNDSPAYQSSRKTTKTRSSSLEILTNAELKLKRGGCYGFIGRNGTGKSTIIRAITERAIPGLPYSLMIACLQQTDRESEDELHQENELLDLSVLQHVIQNDPYRLTVQRDLRLLSGTTQNADTDAAVEQLRRFREYQRSQFDTKLHRYRLQAELRSGARGAQAKKDLLAAEAKAEHLLERSNTLPKSIVSPDAQSELRQSTDLIADLQDKLAQLSVGDREAQARDALTGLGFDETMMNKPVSKLSGGWRMRCALATVLLQTVDLLILDEPTNYLDLLGIVWLQKHLESLKTTGERTIIVVSHDRDFVDAICEDIIILRDKTLSYFPGNITDYEADLRSRIKYLTRMQEAQDKETERAKKSIANTIKQGKKRGDDNALRMAKSKSKKLETQSGMQRSANGGRFKLNRDRAGWQDSKHAAISIPTVETGVSMSFPLATELRNPGALVSLENINLKFKTAPAPTLSNVNLVVHPGDRVGILGLNGSGKSTLIRILAQTLRPSSGTVAHHPQLKLGYYSQHAVEELRALGHARPGITALSLLLQLQDASEAMTEQDVRGLLGTFGLPGRVASDVPIATLSGGQLVRLALVRLLIGHPNLLVLDEVSTHLDYHTVTALAQALRAYDGAVVLVSHDRYLVRRVVEGVKDGDGEGSESESDAEEEREGKREVMRLNKGLLKKLEGGVVEFERSVERKLAELTA